MMSYVTVEDDTASMEMLAFSNVLSQYGTLLRENQPVVVTGRLSMRDDKEPQIVINRVRSIEEFATTRELLEPEEKINGTLYLRLATQEGTMFQKIRAILGMFPGTSQVVVYFADTKKRCGSTCDLDRRMLKELENQLGKENVVVK